MLAVVLDIYLLMCVESGMLKPFLLSCSSESWFRSVAMVLKIPMLDHKQLEKISVLLQKLSKIKWVLRYWGLRKDIVLSLLCPLFFYLLAILTLTPKLFVGKAVILTIRNKSLCLLWQWLHVNFVIFPSQSASCWALPMLAFVLKADFRTKLVQWVMLIARTKCRSPQHLFSQVCSFMFI